MHQLRDPDRTWDGRSYPAGCITRCDAVILTHAHADHTHGLNDLRHLNRLMGMRTIPVFGDAGTLAEVRRMFAFCFGGTDDVYVGYAPALRAEPLTDGEPTVIAGLPVLAFPMSHGPAGRTTGLRCGGLGYLTDFKTFDPAWEASLQGLELLVLDMLREEPHETHLCWAEAEALIARLRPRRTVLTHLGHEVRCAEWAPRLPPDVVLAVDGLRASFTVP